MANYIKRADAMTICERYSQHCFETNDSRGQDIADRILDDIAEMSTTDVDEVRHGEWLQEYEGVLLADDYDEYPYVKCSLCGHIEWNIEKERIDTPNYCSNCGAKMDGGKENDG